MALRLVILLTPLLLSSCVERLIQVKSNPPGAKCYVDGEEKGSTPCAIPFKWYGSREIVLRLSEYKTIKKIENISAPFYQIFPLDFIADLIIPFKITDATELEYIMQKDSADSEQEIVEMQKNASKLKEKIPKDN